MHKVAKQPGKDVWLTLQSKAIITQYFERQKQKGTDVNVLERTAQQQVYPSPPLNRYTQSREAVMEFFTPLRRYAASRIRVDHNSFAQGVIRRVVHSFYERKEYPTVSGVLLNEKEQCGFPGGKFCMWCVLRELGFSYNKRDSKQYIYKQTNMRHTYLQTILKL